MNRKTRVTDQEEGELFLFLNGYCTELTSCLAMTAPQRWEQLSRTFLQFA